MCAPWLKTERQVAKVEVFAVKQCLFVIKYYMESTKICSFAKFKKTHKPSVESPSGIFVSKIVIKTTYPIYKIKKFQKPNLFFDLS